MAKFLKTAALVVGAVALIATGIGAAGGGVLFGTAGTAATATTAATAGTAFGISVGTFTTIGVIAGVAAGALSFAAALATPKGTVGGSQTKFTIDKESGNPVALGRTASGGKVIHRQTHGGKNQFETWVSVHSIGPVRSIGTMLIDQVAQTFSGSGAALGGYAGYMWLASQLGACPEAAALPVFNGPVAGWSNSSKLSGLAADLWCLKFDSAGKKYPSGVPERLRVIEGVFVYDPRLDSTFPGGIGPCRIDNPATYVWSENPALQAITWAYGHWQNGLLVAGGGLDITGIDGAPFAEWASVCDANNWKVGGIVYTATDNSWDVLKMIAQAGGGEVMPVGGQLSCTFSAPRVSIGTITSADIGGDIEAPSSASRRLRRNTVIPKVRLESHGWQVVPLNALTIADYVAVDGAKRPKELDLPLVQDADQGAQLGIYDLMNSRELDGIVLPCKIYAIGYRPGDCVTLQIPEANLIDRDVVIRNRSLEGAAASVTLTARTETAGKHSFALGKTGTPPPMPDLSVPAAYGGQPDIDDWALSGASLSANGTTIPVLILTGAVGTSTADAVVFEYRVHGTTDWIGGGIENAGVTKKEITGVTPGTSYDVAVSYRVRGVIGARRIFDPVTAGDFSTGGTVQIAIANSFSVGSPPSASADGTITIPATTRRYPDGHADVSVNGATIASGLAAGSVTSIAYDDFERAGGAVTYALYSDDIDAHTSPAHPGRHYVGYVIIPTAGSPPANGGGTTPPGGGYKLLSPDS